MAGEDQERFEDYLALEHYIRELQAGHVAHPPDELTPSLARIYRTAALFRSTSIADSQPSSAFAAALQARLEQVLRHPSEEAPVTPSRQRSHVSRRALLTGGAAAAASLVVGTGLGMAAMNLEQQQAASSAATTNSWSTSLVPAGEGSWLPVAKLADLGDEALRFTTDSLVGYIIHSDGDQGEKPGIIALSAACTHMGCLVHWQHTERKYLCPCHGGLFSEYGKPDKASPMHYLTALPRLETRITEYGSDEMIEVRLPANTRPT